MAGIVGMRRGRTEPLSPIEGPDLSAVIRRDGMRVHAGLYPGGGFLPTEYGYAETRRLVAACDTTLTWVAAALDHVEGLTPIAPAVIDTGYHHVTPRDFGARPLQLLFCADDKPRKGLDVALAALAELGGDAPVHLHVVGPHDPAKAAALGLADRTTYHGWMDRPALRDLHARCHVFVSPVTAEVAGDPASDGGIVDGFPTTAAAEAMSSGVLLLTGNPERDHRQLRPGTDHVELPAEPGAFADAIRRVLAQPGEAAEIAASGAARIRERFDVRRGAADRLALMGFGPGRTRYVAPDRAAAAPAPPAAPAAPATPPPPADPAPLAAALDVLRAGQQALTDQVQAMREELAASEARGAAAIAEAQAAREELLQIARVIRDDEPTFRRLLAAARAAPDYERSFTEPDPLVTICIPTYATHAALLERSIPSALAQDHPNIEVVVVGDTAPPETAAAHRGARRPTRALREPERARPLPGGPAPALVRRRHRPAQPRARARPRLLDRHQQRRRRDAPRPRQHAAGGRPAVARRGRLRPAAPARAGRLDAVIGEFPPANHNFGWQLALQHRALLLFEFELVGAPLRRARRLGPRAADAARGRALRPGRRDRLRLLPDDALGQTRVIRFQAPQLPPAGHVAEYFALAEEKRWYSNGGPCHELLVERLEDHLGGGLRCVPVANATLGLMVGLRALAGAGRRAAARC